MNSVPSLILEDPNSSTSGLQIEVKIVFQKLLLKRKSNIWITQIIWELSFLGHPLSSIYNEAHQINSLLHQIMGLCKRK